MLSAYRYMQIVGYSPLKIQCTAIVLDRMNQNWGASAPLASPLSTPLHCYIIIGHTAATIVAAGTACCFMDQAHLYYIDVYFPPLPPHNLSFLTCPKGALWNKNDEVIESLKTSDCIAYILCCKEEAEHIKFCISYVARDSLGSTVNFADVFLISFSVYR